MVVSLEGQRVTIAIPLSENVFFSLKVLTINTSDHLNTVWLLINKTTSKTTLNLVGYLI